MNMFELDDDRQDGPDRAPEWEAVRRALAQAVPPDAVEQALLRAFAQKHARRPWYRRLASHLRAEAMASWAGIGALGCALAITGVGLLTAGAPQMPDARVALVADDGFLALVPPERLAAAVHPQLKEADLPRETLVQMGIPIVADAPDELVHAELLVAATGEPLAIRLAVN